MSNSKLAVVTILSPNCTKPRNQKIDKITIHHMAANLTVEQCGALFAKSERAASANYGIGSDGRIGLYVEEENRSWCSGSRENDHRAITIEVANSGGAPDWRVSEKAYASLIDLCVDICRRNGIKKLNFTGDKTGNLTMHKMFQATDCPGAYLESRFPAIAEEVNRRLSGETPKEGTKKEMCSVNIPVLRKGSKNDTVKAMQALLISNGCSCGSSGIDGSFGGATEKALKDYQRLNGLSVDGVCGPATWKSLLGA